MAHFVPNQLQRALFAEVMNATMETLSEKQFDQAAAAWLSGMQPILSALANIGREGARVGAQGRNAALIQIMSCMHPLPAATLRWLGDWECLCNLTSPAAMRGDDFLQKLQTLATLDEGL